MCRLFKIFARKLQDSVHRRGAETQSRGAGVELCDFGWLRGRTPRLSVSAVSRILRILTIALGCTPVWLHAQTSELRQILDRLDRLERENRNLADEVHALRQELQASRTTVPATVGNAAPSAAGIPERLDIVENRVEEQAQTKVETAQKFPIRITGMALFNAFSNSRANGDQDYPSIALPADGRRAGATMRQTVIGLEFRGPRTVWGGQVHGNVFMDFFGSPGTPLNENFRIRTGSIEIEWKTRSIRAGLEKPIFNPREPASLARVGVSPLTGAGNLWLWVPQIRFEQDVRFDDSTGLRAQIGVMQTRENGPYNSQAMFTERSRPGLEGRFEVYRRWSGERKIEIAPGFHTSTSHVGGQSAPSNLFSLDWIIAPHARFDFSGAFYTGQNLAHLGTGAIRQGLASYDGELESIHTVGGWGQLTARASSRLAFHFFTGQLDDRNSQLRRGALGKNLVFGSNFFYNLAPNVIVSVEASQTRSVFLGTGLRLNNHYDLALAYLF
jgi:hypothetical protein